MVILTVRSMTMVNDVPTADLLIQSESDDAIISLEARFLDHAAGRPVLAGDVFTITLVPVVGP